MKKRIVLDTNAVMDWLVFADPSMHAIATAIENRVVAWVLSDALRDELFHVLRRGVAAAWNPDAARIAETMRRFAEVLSQPDAGAAGVRWRCSDPDDQKFVDFALAHSAHWLVTRDRALLKLARKTAPQGLAIVQPLHWRGT